MVPAAETVATMTPINRAEEEVSTTWPAPNRQICNDCSAVDRRADQKRGEDAPGQIGVIEPGGANRNRYIQHRRRQHEGGTLESYHQCNQRRASLVRLKSDGLVGAPGSQFVSLTPQSGKTTAILPHTCNLLINAEQLM